MKRHSSNKFEHNHILGYQSDENCNPTNNLIKLPFEDRFKHTMIVGPAGCGKTFQCITPMIWNDMQIKNKTVGITVLALDNCLAEKTYAMAVYRNNQIDEKISNGTYKKNQDGEKKIIQYFNPVLKDCPYFNPLEGQEDDVIENVANTFHMMNADSASFIRDLAGVIVRNAVKVLKRLYGNDATFSDLKTIICEPDVGEAKYIIPLKSMKTMPDGSSIPPHIQKEHETLADWFLTDYYTGFSDDNGSKTYQNAEHLRKIIEKINSNKYLNRILNPPRSDDANYVVYENFKQEMLKQNLFYKISFEEALKQGHVVAINTNQHELRDISRFLNYFFIFQLQSAIENRAGQHNHIPNMIYIKDFQDFANWGFADMFRISDNYRVAFHMSTYSLNLMGKNLEKTSKDFCDMIKANVQNHIVFPGICYDDAKYYANRADIISTKTYYNPCHRMISLYFYKGKIYGKNIDPPVDYLLPSQIMDVPFCYFTYLTKYKNETKTYQIKANMLPKELNDLLECMMIKEVAKRCQ